MAGGQDIQRLTATVRGYVQGVGYRYYALQHARALGLTGFARNERDDSVTVVAEGPNQSAGSVDRGVAARPRGRRCSGYPDQHGGQQRANFPRFGSPLHRKQLAGCCRPLEDRDANEY